MGVKGAQSESSVYLGSLSELDFKSKNIEGEVRTFFQNQQLNQDFEYIKRAGKSLITRPTSKTYYRIDINKNSQLQVSEIQPNIVKRLIELHKGHGPRVFKTFQKVAAFGLIFIIISGLMLGLTSNKLRLATASLSLSGLMLFFLLAFS